MDIGQRQSEWRRLLAVAMSLVVVLASVLGMAAHAAEHRYHHGEEQAVAHDLSTEHQHSSHQHSGEEGSQAQPQMASGNADASHANCSDLICHGGWDAVDGFPEVSRLTYARVTFTWDHQTLVGGMVFSLDRPPKHLVHA